MKLFINLFFITILLIACKPENERNTSNKIFGRWIFANEYFIPHYSLDGEEEPPMPPINNLGFNFFSKDSVENDRLFFKIIDPTKDHLFANNREELGRKSKYTLDKDSLKIFDRTFNKWHSYKIIKLDENNLIINDNDIIIKNFVKILKK